MRRYTMCILLNHVIEEGVPSWSSISGNHVFIGLSILTAVSRWKFSSRMRSTGKIELIITSLVNIKLCICLNLASMATPWAKI